MDYRERIGNVEESMRISFESLRARLWTTLPGIIQSYDATRQTCTVQPAIKGSYQAQDGTVVSAALPVLLDCPVQFQGGGGGTLTFPLKAGDECLIVFSSRCMDGWWQLGGAQGQTEMRMHDLSDGFVLPGVRSLPRALTNVSTSTVQLRADDGLTYVDLDPTGQIVKIKAPGGITLDTPLVTTTGNVTSQGNVLAVGSISDQNGVHGSVASMRATYNSHTHTDPQGGTVGAANPQTA